MRAGDVRRLIPKRNQRTTIESTPRVAGEGADCSDEGLETTGAIRRARAVARQAFHSDVYWNIGSQKRPVRPTSLSSDTFSRGMAMKSDSEVQAPCCVVTARVKPISFTICRVSGDQLPLGYAKA